MLLSGCPEQMYKQIYAAKYRGSYMTKTLYQNMLDTASTMLDSRVNENMSIFKCVERINSMASDVLEDLNKTQTPSRLQNFIDEVQELVQILSVPHNLFNINSSLEHQRQIEYLAFYDSLTGLSNRQFFEIYTKQLIGSANKASVFYLVFLDLDGFKLINDTYGHEIGDEVLKCIAHRLRDNLRMQDVVARFGGDEFTILLQLDEQESLNYVLTRLIASITEPLYVSSLCLSVNVSLGVSNYPLSSESYETLINKADKAMYMSKSRGNNLYTIHQ